MRLFKVILEPDLRSVLIGITTYGFCFSLMLILTSTPILSILALFMVWLILFAGMQAKIKGFKITNGIFGFGMFILSSFSMILFIKSVIDINFFGKNWVDTGSNNLAFVLITPMLFVFVSSIYTTYITIFNQHFSSLYRNKEDVSAFRKNLFKIILTIFIIVMGMMTWNDLVNLRLI
jgi:hypothetical protein